MGPLAAKQMVVVRWPLRNGAGGGVILTDGCPRYSLASLPQASEQRR